MVYDLADAIEASEAFATRKGDRRGETAARVGSTDPYWRGAGTRAWDVFDRRHDCKNDHYGKSNRKSCKDKTRDHVALPYSNNNQLNLSPSLWFHAIPDEVWSVQDIQAPFDHFNDGNSYGDGESKKQNELDDHFLDP
jgi:hypothetical protein